MDTPGNVMFQPSELVVGDFVQARRHHESGTVEVVEGLVVGVDGTTVDLDGPNPDSGEGWLFELISRPLTFPTSLCEIDAVLMNGEQIRLMGRDTSWMAVGGRQVQVSEIRSFEVTS